MENLVFKFVFPLLLSADSPLSRTELSARLEAAGIATRPISGSNLARQPAFSQLPRVRIEGELPVADAVHERGLFVGQSHAFGPAHGGAYPSPTPIVLFMWSTCNVCGGGALSMGLRR